jgi:signal transduction histidine kinase
MPQPNAESDRTRLLESTAPLERMAFFRGELQLQDEAMAVLAPYSKAFVTYAKDYADQLYAKFDRFAQTQLMLHMESSPGRLRRSWEYWFRALWTSGLDERFINMVWRSGVLHVALGIDQRFIDLAYGYTRRYCRDMAEREVPIPELRKVLRTVDALLDFCMLLGTDAFISSTQRCDTEVMMGVAHQLRNPLTVIGGNAMRIRRSQDTCADAHDHSQAILEEAFRLERLVKAVGTYVNILNLKPVFEICSVPLLMLETLQILRPEYPSHDFEPELTLAENNALVRGDERCLRPLFLQTLRNCLEALDKAKPRLRIASRPSTATPGFLQIEIENSGPSPDPDMIAVLFEPFYSTRPLGTGFGLPIARLAAKKCMGSVTLTATPQGGRYTILLALPGAAGESEFFTGD